MQYGSSYMLLLALCYLSSGTARRQSAASTAENTVTGAENEAHGSTKSEPVLPETADHQFGRNMVYINWKLNAQIYVN